MRGLFALVLAAGVGAAAFVLLGRGEATDPGSTSASGGANLARTLPAEDVRVVADVGDPAPQAVTPERQREVRTALLTARAQSAKGDDEAAAETLLAVPSGLADAELRGALLDISERLADSADRAADDVGMRLRLAARRMAAAVYGTEAAASGEHDRAFATCKRVHEVLLFGLSAPESLVLRHRLAAGELVWKLAHGPWRQAGVTVDPGFVLYVNGISDARRVRAGKTLRVPREELTLLIRKSRFELTVLLGGAPVERFDIGIGASGSTPAGRMKVLTKQENPDWYFDGRRIPYGHPDNVIGTRWMGLEGDARAEGIGIHGTTDETTVGRAVSMGCIRMRREEVERLFTWVARGTRVEIRD